MRAHYVLVLCLLFMLPMSGSCQQNGIDNALKKGDAEALGFYFSPFIDLSIPGIENTYSADKTISFLADFFNKLTIKGYKKIHVSAPQKGRSVFTIGDLYTIKGTYRVTLIFNKDRKISEVEIRT